MVFRFNKNTKDVEENSGALTAIDTPEMKLTNNTNLLEVKHERKTVIIKHTDMLIYKQLNVNMSEMYILQLCLFHIF